MIGETLSHFKVTDKLGQGGMGVVYRGMDLDLDRPVAIKILPAEAQTDEDSVGRFLREAKTASKLQHPAITTIYEFGVKENMRYLVMEYIEGKTLRKMLEKGPLPIRQLIEITIQVADALSLADEKGIIHRDIKSENIMLTERGQVKILDFGLAKMLEKTGPVAADTFQTAQGVVMGTITHMSPEQTLGAELDARSDIYSTGVVMFEMATGQVPFTGTSPNVVLAKILNQPPPAPSDLNPEVPPALEKVIFKCLEKNRDQRYQSAMHLMVEMRALKQQIESQRDWSGTMVMPAKDLRLTQPAVESLRELVPPTVATTPPPTAPSGATQAVRTPSGGAAAATGVVARPVSGVAVRPAISPAARAWRLRICFLAATVRMAISLAVGLYILGALAMFFLPLFKAQQVASLAPVRLLHQVFDPTVAVIANLVNFRFEYQKFNFLFLGLALGGYILMQIITGRLVGLEAWIRKPLMVKAPTVYGAAVAGAAARSVTGSGAQAASRMSLLRDYSAAKRILGEVKKEMAFLSADVVGSTKMKLGEDKISIEHAFAEYKKFLERIFHEFRVYKVAWTPDGVMVCFPSADDAASAGRKLLKELDWFNRDVHQLRTKFHVRCGLNFGEVLMPEDKPLEEVSDEVIDVAGHLQKYAEEDTLWVSGEVYTRLQDRSGFSRLAKQVDNHDVYAWLKPPSG